MKSNEVFRRTLLAAAMAPLVLATAAWSAPMRVTVVSEGAGVQSDIWILMHGSATPVTATTGPDGVAEIDVPGCGENLYVQATSASGDVGRSTCYHERILVRVPEEG